MRRGWSVLITALVAMLLVLAGCTGSTRRPSTPTKATQHRSAPAVVPLKLMIGPATATRNAPVTTEVTTTVTGGRVAAVTLADSAGTAVAGAMRADGSSWVPAAPLAFRRTYTARVTATGTEGRTVTATTTFTTMGNPGPNRIGTGLYLWTGGVYGVGMPVVVEFDAPVPDRDKAAVERRLFVRSDPPQMGVWRWYGDRQVLYRPRVYWQPGTVLTVRSALAGLPVGGRYVDVDRGATVTIGAAQRIVVSDKDKTLSVYRNGALLKSFAVSLGKPSTPTSSGNFVLMSREYSTRFKTSEYSITAYYAERFTWGGQFLHAAPWSVGDQGADNVSHGCVNLSMDSARWVYENSQVGDPVTVTGTEVHLVPGDGWTVWDIPWSEYLTGSALPHPELQPGAPARGSAGYTFD